MVTLIKYGALSGGEKYNVNVLSIDGLSTDTKPTVTYIEYGSDGREVGRMGIPNGSLYTEIDTGDTYMYDADNTTWHKVSIEGGGGGTSGGIVLVGETTTQLIDNATTNPITVDGRSYTAQPNDAVIYGNKEFLFDGTKWHEFGDLSGLSSNNIGAMTNYVKAQTGAAITTTDTLNQAIGKVEKRVDDNENNISLINHAANTSLYFSETEPSGSIIDGSYWISTGGTKIYRKCYQMFDKTTALVEGKFIRVANPSAESPLGTEVINASYNCSDYIDVLPNTTYTITYPIAATAYSAGLAEFTSGGVYISGVNTNEQGQTYTFTTSPTTSKIRFSWANSSGNNVMLNEGSTAIPYEDYFISGWQSNG